MLCYYWSLVYNVVTGYLNPYLYYADTRTLLPGGRYRSDLDGAEGDYTYDAATRTLSYTSGPYRDVGFVGVYQPPQDRKDDHHFILNVTDGFETECYDDQETAGDS